MAKAAAIARPRRTKADVQQEFLKIREEVAATAEGRNTKIDEAAKLKETGVRQAVEGLSVEGVAQRISALSVQISKALAEVSDDLIAEVQRLATVREAVALESTELERLHKVDVAATALDQLVQEHDAKRQALETSISSQRAAWEAEARTHERADKEYDENLKRLRQRETEEFEYKKALERKKAQDKYEEEIRTLEKKNREKQETLDKTWQQREAALKEREEELTRLRQEVSSFPARLQTEVERARSEAVQQTEQRFDQQVLLCKPDCDGAGEDACGAGVIPATQSFTNSQGEEVHLSARRNRLYSLRRPDGSPVELERESVAVRPRAD